VGWWRSQPARWPKSRTTAALIRPCPPAARCIITITIHPTDAATGSDPQRAHRRSVGIPPDDSVAAGDRVAPPTAIFTPASVTFPAQRAGTPETTRVVWLSNEVVANLGSLSMTVGSVTIGARIRLRSDRLGRRQPRSSSDPNYSCPVAVGFDPNQAGTLTASLLSPTMAPAHLRP